MSSITLLDQNTINKIAAGEVVERPAAVVKELVENSIDSGANAVTIEIKDGGTSLIRITDNGSGINKDEIHLAFERHATSKIRTVEDLLSVSSLGFRGEALASIASVAQVEAITKTGEELTGIRYVIEGGVEKSKDEIGCPDGTTFLIRNIFFNTPARKKFLKTNNTEASYVSDLVERLAVSHPDVAFKFINNNQMKLSTSGNGNVKDILYQIYGRDIARELLPIEKDEGVLSLKGFIGKPVISRANRNYMNYFINGRYVKSSVIHKAIEEAYAPYTMTHRYPFVSLSLEVAPEWIDVNVHPTKMEIRFHDSQMIYEIVYNAIKEALGQREFIPEVTLSDDKENKEIKKEPVKESAPEPFEKKRMTEYRNDPKNHFHMAREDFGGIKHFVTPEEENVTQKPAAPLIDQVTGLVLEPSMARGPESTEYGNNHNLDDFMTKSVDSFMNDTQQQQVESSKEDNIDDLVQNPVNKEKPSQLNMFEEKLLAKESVPNHRIIGQIFNTYWIVEFDDKMYMIDQHAAHEKVLYERTMAKLKEKEPMTQMIQPPMVISLSMREEQALSEYQEKFKELGFEIEHFGGKEYALYGVPADLLGLAEKEIFIELLDSFVEESSHLAPEMILEKVASMSCKAAVKGNNKMSFAEAEALINDLLTLENPYNCPHGRPVIISMTKYEVEKKFKRIV